MGTSTMGTEAGLTKKRERVYKAMSVGLALVLWQGAAIGLNSELILSSPIKTAVRLMELVQEASFWQAVGFTFSRIAAGFLLGALLGTGLGLLAGRFRGVEVLLWPYMKAAKTVPVASFIILSLFFLKARELSVFISFLMVLPVLYENVRQGVKSTDKALLEMGQVFKVPYGRRLMYIYLPALKPFLLSGCGTALGLCWKAGVAAEVIAVTANSMGGRLYDAKVYFMTSDLLAWTAVIVLISVGFEKLVLWGMQRGYALLEGR